MKTTELPSSSTITATDTIVSNVSSTSRKVTVNTLLNSEGFTDDFSQTDVDTMINDVFSIQGDPEDPDSAVVTQQEVNDMIDRIFQ